MSKNIYSYNVFYDQYMSTKRCTLEFEEPVFIGDIIATEEGLCNVIQKIIFPIENAGVVELVVKKLDN